MGTFLQKSKDYVNITNIILGMIITTNITLMVIIIIIITAIIILIIVLISLLHRLSHYNSSMILLLSIHARKTHVN